MTAILSVVSGLALFTVLVVGAGAIYGVRLYNRIVRHRNQVEEAHGSVQAHLKKRHDLIPNLVSTVREYADHESETLTEVVELRNKAVSDDLSAQERQEVESQLTQALDTLMVQVEDYPDLTASDNFEHLQRSLNDVEEQLSAARRFYNAAVKRYNDSIQTFPGTLIAREFGFDERDGFEAEVHEHETPDVKALFDD